MQYIEVSNKSVQEVVEKIKEVFQIQIWCSTYP